MITSRRGTSNLPLARRGFVEIVVADDGRHAGEVLAGLHPYFTTKAAGSGTGLRLPRVSASPKDEAARSV